jgi:hypothetical protein
MSSFNVSCGLTHQTISPTDDCLILFVKQAYSTYVQGEALGENMKGIGTIQNISEPDAYWLPHGKLLHVEYEGDGYFNLLDKNETFDNAYDIVRDFFNIGLVVDADPTDPNSMEFDFVMMIEKNCPNLYLELLIMEDAVKADPNLIFEELNTALSYIQTFSRIGQLYYPNHQNKLISMLTFPIHEHAYEKMLDKISEIKREDGFDNTIRGKVESLLDDIDRAIAMGTPDDVSSVEHLHTSMPSSEVKIFNVIIKKLIEGKQTIDTDHGVRIFSRYFEESTLLEAMEYLNLKIIPQVFSNDDQQNQKGLEYAKLVIDVSNHLTRKRQLKG